MKSISNACLKKNTRDRPMTSLSAHSGSASGDSSAIDPPDASAPEPPHAVLHAELEQAIAAALARLPPPQRAAVQGMRPIHPLGDNALKREQGQEKDMRMAPPLAGSMNMRFLRFIRLDFVGATLYASAYFTLGFLFSDALGPITRGYQSFGHLLTWLVAAAALIYLGIRVWMWLKKHKRRQLGYSTGILDQVGNPQSNPQSSILNSQCSA